MNIKHLSFLLFFSNLFFSCGPINSIQVNKRDGLMSYKIYNIDKPDEYKYACEIQIDSKSIIEIKDSEVTAKGNKITISSIGFASIWINYDEKYFFDGIKQIETVESTNIIYALFNEDIKDCKLYYKNNQIKIS